jgi:hypothetical protein
MWKPKLQQTPSSFYLNSGVENKESYVNLHTAVMCKESAVTSSRAATCCVSEETYTESQRSLLGVCWSFGFQTHQLWQAKQQETTLIAAWLAKADLFGKQNSNKPLAVFAGSL